MLIADEGRTQTHDAGAPRPKPELAEWMLELLGQRWWGQPA